MNSGITKPWKYEEYMFIFKNKWCLKSQITKHMRCKPIPVKTGFSLCTFPKREKPVFITGIPANVNRFFPVWEKYTGKTLFWPCTGPVRDCSVPKEWCQITPVSDFQLRTRCLREWFDTSFFGIWAKVIIFLRLSHLYYAYNSMVWTNFWRSIWIFAMLLFGGFFWRIYVKKIKRRS